MAASTAVHSTAFNFLSFIQSGVDPRTGQYTINMTLPEIKANDLSGPIVPLTLNFNPLNQTNSGFGIGWELRLSQYDADKKIIALSTGETFKVTGDTGGTRLEMAEQKIRNFHLYRDAPTLYRVVHKSGAIEMLRLEGNLALPETVYSPEGFKVSFAYLPFDTGLRRLHQVTDGQGVTLLEINRPPNSQVIEILLRPDGSPGGALARIELKLRNSGPGEEVYEVVLPTEDQASWRLTYRVVNGLLCLIDVKTPSGGHETLEYAGIGHAFPGFARPPLPRVWKHVVHPGFKQPPLEVRYDYNNDSNLPGSSNNFLANNARINWDPDGIDNMLQVTTRYQYGTTERHFVDDVEVRVIERTFNRFHLITEEKTTQGNNVHQVFTLYYADDNLDLMFANQPAQCQLPKQVLTRWGLKDGSTPSRTQTVATTYDAHGNLTSQTQANGVMEEYEYFPVAGIIGECPPDPQGFMRNLRKKTVTPAPGHEAGAPVLRTRHEYALMKPLAGGATDTAGDWLAMTTETLYEVEGTDERELQHTAYQTFNTPSDALLHGRRAQQTIMLNGLSTCTQYAYKKCPSAFAGETVLQTVETLTGYDHGIDGTFTEKSVTLEHSLLHGQPLLERDDNDVEIRSTYDALLRVTSETVAPGTKYEATRTYSYLLTRIAGEQAIQETTDVKGVKTRTLFNGVNQVLQEQRQDKDHLSGARAGDFRDTYLAEYDGLGQLIKEIEYDWRSADPSEDLVLVSEYQYDDWGQQCSMKRADGVDEYEVTDPIKQTVTQWITGQGKTVTTRNLFDKPVSIRRYNLGDDAQAEPYSEQRYAYDGLGRTAHEFDPLSRKTAYVYDAFERMLKTTLANGDVMERSYALHSSADLPTTLRVTPADSSQKPVLAGAQVFDGLERLTELSVGPRLEKYQYKDSQLQVGKRITPANQTIEYVYSPGLPDQPTAINNPERDQASYGYDFETAHLGFSENSQGRHEFDYDSAAHLKAHRWTLDGHTWRASYQHSLDGRPLSRTDVSDVSCHYTYGEFSGQLKAVHQGNLQAEFDYDTSGRLCLTRSQDSVAKTTLTTELEYDDQGREILRTVSFSGHPTHTIRQTWLPDDRLLTRHWQSAGRTLLEEEFSYDPRGRLELYFCSGEQPPTDRYGNQITQELYVLDALDNISLRRSRFKDGTQDTTEFSYADDDPCQLKGLTHTHASMPSEVSFRYDLNGNMLNDELGHRLRYDSQGRLLDVSDRQARTVTAYRYDSHNHLIGVKPSGEAETLRFYEDDRLSNTVQGDTHTQYLYHEGRPLGQQQSQEAGKTSLLMTDAKHSVIAENQGAELRTSTYAPYGERGSDSARQSPLGFNGEMAEANGWYLLGRGYRTYNPRLHRFHNVDLESPFHAGGVNPYQYCLGDPVNFKDPSGRSVFWDVTGILFSTLSIASGNPMLIALGVGGVFAGQTALASSMLGDEETANKARTVAMVLGFAEMGASGLSRGGQEAAATAIEGASRNLLKRTKDATYPLGASKHLLKRSKNATYPLAASKHLLKRTKESTYPLGGSKYLLRRTTEATHPTVPPSFLLKRTEEATYALGRSRYLWQRTLNATSGTHPVPARPGAAFSNGVALPDTDLASQNIRNIAPN
ncbi:RHS repeat domain-containing protein [Pseudomonas fluorescens]|uniref:RHS repeat domain-containing protein n=1 Tax=Pseudomonas fluorescens TaxID=294 RepID=UPI0019135C5B|nr:RHS repeat-associated core domain-containing protein [Pseudomonas fluorescens]